MNLRILLCAVLMLSFSHGVHAQDCDVQTRACVIEQLIGAAEEIEIKNWKDQTYREIAKTLAADNDLDRAISMLDHIQNPDTKALTIRGIGMAAAGNKLSQEELDSLFTKLRAQSELIDHPPSYAIALTYIAMAQAFAKDDDGAWTTASEMENDALRNKAYGETAEIQAEFGKFDAAMKSIGFITTESFRNKAYTIVSKLLADRGYLQEAFDAAGYITNAYKKATALQYVLDVQTKRKREGQQ